MVPLSPDGIIYCLGAVHKYSAVLLDNRFVLTSGLVLLQAPSLTLPEQNIVDVCSNQDVHFLSQMDYRLVLKEDNGKFSETKVRIAYILNSIDIYETLKHQLRSLKFVYDGEYKNITEYGRYLSAFVILKYHGQNNLLLEDLKQYFKYLRKESLRGVSLMEEIVLVSAPFGNEYFINSVNLGHVANLLGKDNCLSLLNVNSAFGCEGGAVYDKLMNLRSILLCSCFIYQEDNVCFPLAANVSEVYKILFDKAPPQEIVTKLAAMMFNSTCMIDAMGSWGTGCIFQLNSRSFVLTCAHVLSTENITCYCHGLSFRPSLVYKNPRFDSAYDVALLENTTNNSLQSNLPKLARYKPIVGQTVYSVGFPVFKNFAIDGTFKPSIYRGRVTNYSKGMVNTDCMVQTGQSGGPIYDSKGDLLAVMVSNFRSALDNRIFPQHNMCIPICDIYDSISQYSQSNDVNILSQLQAEKSIADKWKLKYPIIESKM